MKIISTDKAPAAIGPYSQAYCVNGLLFTSGQIALNPATGEIVGTDIEAQAEQCCKNVGAILEAAGTDFSKVVKTTCFLADMKDFAAFNAVYAKYFVSKPARSCVAFSIWKKHIKTAKGTEENESFPFCAFSTDRKKALCRKPYAKASALRAASQISRTQVSYPRKPVSRESV